MKQSMFLGALCLAAVFAPVAGAYEYPLQFTPNSGYRGLVVAGYSFEGAEVVGNCSYYTVSASAGSGKGGGGRAPVNHTFQQTCRWDLFGNLLSITPGAPAEPAPLSVNGTQVVYADNGTGSYTGADSKLPQHGFVSTFGPHYTWLTPRSNAALHQLVYTLVATLQSDGDGPVTITAVDPSALNGKVTLKSTTCIGEIKTGSACTISVTYDPTSLTSTTGRAYDTIRIDVTSDAGEAHDFIQNYTIVMARKP